ncbi:MAG: trkA, partial [Chlamydiia bacterium]|nr:trkA [Chlamydiia bacterium]
MHIIILGAGRIGQFVAHSLSLDGHSVVLVDMNREKLEEASLKMDVAIKRGIGTDWKLLDELMEEAPELLLALTEDDEVNLVACTIAKSLGKIRTIARVKDSRYLRHDHYDVGHLFHVDHLVVPELLVAEQISKISMNQGLYSESFFHGGILLRTATIPTGWEY